MSLRIWNFLENAFWIAMSLLCIGFALVGVYGIVSGDTSGWFPFIFFGLGSIVFVVGAVNRLHRDPSEMTPAERAVFDEKLERDERICIELVKNLSLPVDRHEPIPPWIKYPGLHPHHIFWRMGDGESYLKHPFGPFMSELDRSEREQYFTRYDLGTDWPHRGYWYHGWVEREY